LAKLPLNSLTNYCIKKEYYKGGQLKTEIEYRDSLKNGYLKEYYRNGIIKLESLYEDNIPVGNEYGYYDNEVLEYYLLFDYRGNIRYKLSYSIENDSIIEEGKGMHVVVIGDKKPNCVGDTIRLEAMICDPYKEGYKLYVNILGEKDKSNNSEFKITRKVPVYNFVGKEAGQDSILFVSNVLRNNKVFRRDSVKVFLNFIKCAEIND